MKPLILLGMNPKTRSLIPWDSDTEIWTLNEAPVNKWMKRWDVLFQLHPRWDWERNNNISDPNHPLFIKAQSGNCLFCLGTGMAMNEGKDVECPYCEAGQYTVPEHRKGKTIIMQDVNKDVPGCKRLPIQTMVKGYCLDGNQYFTSTFAHMLVYAFLSDYTDIQIFGFEMESETEYIHQRPCAEYWIGYGRALGIKIEAPGAGILKGEHYAYQSSVQGYRTRLELRHEHLRDQLRNAEAEAVKSEGALNAVTPFKNIPEVTPAFDLHFDEHFRRKGFVSFVRGAIRETENLIKLYDAYNADGSEKPSDASQMLGLTYELG
jgi:hypothetical protein